MKKNNNIKKLFEDNLRKTNFYKELEELDDNQKTESIKYKNRIIKSFIYLIETINEIEKNSLLEENKQKDIGEEIPI